MEVHVCDGAAKRCEKHIAGTVAFLQSTGNHGHDAVKARQVGRGQGIGTRADGLTCQNRVTGKQGSGIQEGERPAAVEDDPLDEVAGEKRTTHVTVTVPWA